MAIDLVPGSNPLEYTHFHTGFNPIVTAAPLSIFARVKLNGTPGALGSVIWSVERIPPGFGGYQGFELLITSDLKPVIKSRAGAGPFPSLGQAESPTALEIGTWYDICGVIASNSSRKIFVNQVQKAVQLTTVNAPAGLEGIIIGAGYTVSVGFYNQPLAACVQDLVLWRIALTDDEVTGLLVPGNPTALHQTDIPFHVPFAAAGSATVAWDYTSGVPVAVTLAQRGTGGSVTTCSDSPGGPPPAAGDCEGEDVADAVPAVAATWPTCDLVPEDIDVQAVSETQTPGRALSGRQQIVQRAAGHWRIELIGIPIWTKAHALLARQIETALDGRNGTIMVPFYEAKLSATPIAATAAGDFAIGDVVFAITQTAGAAIRAGMHFSIAERGYRIKRVRAADADGNFTVIIWPPLREATALGGTLNFNDPMVRCRLERDDGMAVMLENLAFGKHTVAFVEDV